MTKAKTKPTIEVAEDPAALAELAADWLLARATRKTGVFSVALSGGSTPRRLYQLLASAPRRAAFPWERTCWFWGDERFVPHDDAASNYRMVNEAMLSRAPVPAENIHPMPTEGLEPEAAAAVYERTLKQFYGAQELSADKPLFDVVLLGLGTNGHTASLFPGTKVLEERRRWVGTMTDPEAGTRLTLTYPVLESSRETAFLVAGEDKRAVLRQVLGGDTSLPAARLHPQGSLHFLVDRAAAGEGRS
ncbi:6-phosphogluconolactonase [Enhydrobacter sp.]|jgi:6-phosphogluconolactonase|uniref:6-phosphogluconolactonase n=1 Tax=Enhydrobacter sp. TaxID=1894999 RepID=UPI00260208F9|nr:6-phosphogluconolactonase [Enhydrobacter sp.]WIM12638.1 MAG: 6-phosphogluconolactonase, eukaryotic type [Enhydrobacter sp.]